MRLDCEAFDRTCRRGDCLVLAEAALQLYAAKFEGQGRTVRCRPDRRMASAADAEAHEAQCSRSGVADRHRSNRPANSRYAGESEADDPDPRQLLRVRRRRQYRGSVRSENTRGHSRCVALSTPALWALAPISSIWRAEPYFSRLTTQRRGARAASTEPISSMSSDVGSYSAPNRALN